MSQGKCRGCGAEIDFLRMKTGGKMPVERKPVKGVVAVWDNDKVRFRNEMLEVYLPHWASCPKADKFRKKEAGK